MQNYKQLQIKKNNDQKNIKNISKNTHTRAQHTPNPTHPLAKEQKPIKPSDLGQYTTVIVHDSAKQSIPWSANLIEGSQRFYVSSVKQKITAILSGIGIGYLPVNLIAEHIKAKKLHVVELIEPRPIQDLYLAWKITNKGKGLKQLTQIILNNI